MNIWLAKKNSEPEPPPKMNYWRWWDNLEITSQETFVEVAKRTTELEQVHIAGVRVAKGGFHAKEEPIAESGYGRPIWAYLGSLQPPDSSEEGAVSERVTRPMVRIVLKVEIAE